MTSLSKPVLLAIGGALVAFVAFGSSSASASGKFDPLKPPTGPETEDDVAFTRWIHNPASGAPRLDTDDTKPSIVTRKLTSYERWVLKPYFYIADLDKVVIKNGIRPAGVPADKELPGGKTAPGSNLLALTTADGTVWFPHAPVSFLNRWWLAALAHELYHVGQIRLGSTNAEATEAWEKYGYYDSPIEVSARWKQTEVYNGVTKAARAFAEKPIV